MAILEPRYRPLTPVLRPLLCQDDRACELQCPEGAIVITDVSPAKHVWRLDPKKCTGCGLCILACAEHALRPAPPTGRSLDEPVSWTLSAATLT